MTDDELAASLARSAGRMLVELRTTTQLTGKALGNAGDAVANGFLVGSLREQRPADAILSEEERDSEARLAASRVWVIDPLDGTREFGEGRTDFAVHVALSIDGRAALGAVALPGLGVTLSSADVPAAARATPGRAPRLVVSRSRPASEALSVARELGGELLPMGSAGAKAMAVVRGEADIYLHSGGQYEWDSCAPVAVAQAAGLHVSRLDGSGLRYNQRDTYMPDLLICLPEFAARVLKAVRAGAAPI
jgi:3'(2'), 5'-bisphosphate nucleotidase